MTKGRRAVLALTAAIGLAFTASGSAYPASPVRHASGMANVPYVGCASDGQLGPQPPPKPSKPTPRLPASAASRLAYYASVNNGVLAPRGWHCFSLYGSSGASVYVTPEPIDGRTLIQDGASRFKGEGIAFSSILGGTSGRFEVAKVSSKFFPIAHGLVASVAKEEKEIGIPFDLSGNEFRNDQIVSRTDKVVRFITPAGKHGLGTDDRFVPNRSPVAGLAALVFDDGETDLMLLNARLPLKDRDLLPAIQSVAEANHGDPLSDTSLQDLPEEGATAPRRPR